MPLVSASELPSRGRGHLRSKASKVKMTCETDARHLFGGHGAWAVAKDLVVRAVKLLEALELPTLPACRIPQSTDPVPREAEETIGARQNETCRPAPLLDPERAPAIANLAGE